MRKLICLFCKLKISLSLITCALIDHNACAIFVGGYSQAKFAPKGLGGFINVNSTLLGVFTKFVDQGEVKDK